MHLLNDAQKKAVETISGPVLIVAGAGSGKTGVITYRILNLIKNGVSPDSILAITFTNKAAKEMKGRIDALLASNMALNRPISVNERPFVSTFHALGVHIIRQNAPLLGLNRHFTIYDRADSKRAIKESMLEIGVDPKKIEPGTILNMISRAKGDAVDRNTYSDQAKDYMQETTSQVWQRYENILIKEKALDFDDLLLKTAELLANNETVRRHYSSVWKFINVDEYQDTNRVQYKIARFLAESHRNICAVGDIDQNIYSWRGATIDNILNFEKDYPEAAIITLEKNYRSTKNILAAANSIIEKNRMRKKKTLYTDNDEGEKIAVMVSYTETDEARNIADTAKNLIDSGVLPKNIAVLYRANFQSRAIEESFIKKNIPYQLVGTRFFERKEIKDILSYVRAALNRDSFADISRIINVPSRGIGKVTVSKILSGREDLLPTAAKTKVDDFWKLLGRINNVIHENKPSEAIRLIIQETGIEKSFRRGDAEDEERLLNVRELVTVASQYDNYTRNETRDSKQSEKTSDESGQIPGIEALLENAALATDQDDLQKDEEAVKLMTVHASKGLEFDHVFIAGLEQDLFPYRHIDEKDVGEHEAEEERRLFYVAITRARKKVYLSYAITRTVYGAQRVSAPSEFIEDIDKSLIEEIAPPDKPSGAKALFIDF